MMLLAATLERGKAAYCVVETIALDDGTVHTFCGKDLVKPEVVQAFSIAENQLCKKCRGCFQEDWLQNLFRH